MHSEIELHIFHGRCLSPGLADGEVVVQGMVADGLQDRANHAPDTSIDDQHVEAEYTLLDVAVDKVTDDLLQLAATVDREISAPLGQVFDAHRLIVNDDSLRTEIRREITENLVNAGAAVRIVFGRWEERFLRMKSNISRSKSDDMADVSQRLHDALNKVLHPQLANIPPGCVLVRPRLLPSDTIFIADHLPAAVILDSGSQGSHAALFAREIGLPCIVGCHGLREHLSGHSSVYALVDASRGELTLAPNALATQAFAQKKQIQARNQQRALATAQTPAVTIDGTRVAVMANVGSAHDAKRALKCGADGIGLLRMEQLYLARLTPPDAAELVAIIRPILEPFHGKPICVRLLDAGADKQLPFLGVMTETNPALGCRGIRLLRTYPHLLDTGLRALVELSHDFMLSILIPLVTVIEDITVVAKSLKKICIENLCEPPPLGAMIETPAAALLVDTFIEHLDFISFGTNDLTQYCFAVDRESATVDEYFLDCHEAIFRLMQLAIQAAPELPASLCGELAARSQHIARLIELGITSLSVAPLAIVSTKQAVRQVNNHAASILGQHRCARQMG